MPPHVDILGQPESLARPLAGSLALHVWVFSMVLAFSWLGSRTSPSWGGQNPGGGAFTVNVVDRIPGPARRGVVNPVANDTESSVPQPPPQATAKTQIQEPEPDAVPLKSRTAAKRPWPVAASINRYRAQQVDRPNQLYSAGGQALVTPLIGTTGTGGIGLGSGPFGDRFGYYVDLLRQRVAQKWRTGDVDPRLRTAPPVIITFTILRNGSIRDVRVAQRSGNLLLDLSAQRAIADAAPFPPLPAGYEKNEAPIEFWFQLKR